MNRLFQVTRWRREILAFSGTHWLFPTIYDKPDFLRKTAYKRVMAKWIISIAAHYGSIGVLKLYEGWKIRAYHYTAIMSSMNRRTVLWFAAEHFLKSPESDLFDILRLPLHVVRWIFSTCIDDMPQFTSDCVRSVFLRRIHVERPMDWMRWKENSDFSQTLGIALDKFRDMDIESWMWDILFRTLSGDEVISLLTSRNKRFVNDEFIWSSAMYNKSPVQIIASVYTACTDNEISGHQLRMMMRMAIFPRDVSSIVLLAKTRHMEETVVCAAIHECRNENIESLRLALCTTPEKKRK